MENKELGKNIPAELNEDALGMVTGGSEIAETWNPRPTTGNPGMIINSVHLPNLDDTQTENDIMPVGAITEA